MKIRRWKNQERSNNIEESLKMKVTDFQWFPIAVDESTDLGDTTQSTVCVRGRYGVQYNQEINCLNTSEGGH
jgi:hypothetical protein